MGLLSNRIKLILIIVLLLGAIVVIRQSTFMFVLNTRSANIPDLSLANNPRYLPSDQAKILLVTDEESQAYNQTTQDFFDQLKMSYQVIDAKEYMNPSHQFDLVILAIERFESLGNPHAIFDYMEEGGHVYFTRRVDVSPMFYEFYQALGIIEFSNLEDVRSMRLRGEFLPSFQQRGYEGDYFYNSSLVLQLLSEVDVWVSSNSGIPILWSRDFGAGKLTYFNGTMTMSKDFNMYLYTMVNDHFDNFLHPVLNTKIMVISEFPSPVYEGETPHIVRDYRRNNRTFYREIWWQELLGLERRLSLLYSAAVLLNYDEESHEILIDSEDYVYFAREILYQDGELGFHDMTFNQKEGAHIKWLPNYDYHFYMPVDGHLSDDMIQEASIPENSIEGIVYDYYLNNASLVPLIGQSDNGFISVPYFTKGYVLDDEMLWKMDSNLRMTGAFHHVIRGNVEAVDPWRESFSEFGKRLEGKLLAYPFLQSKTISGSFKSAVKYQEVSFSTNETAGGMTIVPSLLDETYVYLNTDKKISSIEGGTYESVQDGLYFITITGDICTIEWSNQ